MCLNSVWTPQACRSPMGLQSGMSVTDGSPIRHVCLANQACLSGRSGMLVSNKACRGLRWVSDQACRSSMLQVEVSEQA